MRISLRPLHAMGPGLLHGLSGTLLLALFVAGCGGGSGPGPAASGARTPEAVWDGLYQPRPEPLTGAPRVTVSEILLLNDPWQMATPIPTALGIQEILSADLLRRRDVQFVERRRFSQAAERERRGQAQPRGAPPVGTSPGAELALSGSWAAMGQDSAYLDVRMVNQETGQVAASFRRATPADADPVALARQITSGLLATLADMDRLPEWRDPEAGAAPGTYRPSGIPMSAVAAFFRGVAAEDDYQWEGAREAYQEALDQSGGSFLEARVALARVARLRAGGSLGAGHRP